MQNKKQKWNRDLLSMFNKVARTITEKKNGKTNRRHWRGAGTLIRDPRVLLLVLLLPVLITSRVIQEGSFLLDEWHNLIDKCQRVSQQFFRDNIAHRI